MKLTIVRIVQWSIIKEESPASIADERHQAPEGPSLARYAATMIGEQRVHLDQNCPLSLRLHPNRRVNLIDVCCEHQALHRGLQPDDIGDRSTVKGELHAA